MKIAVLCSGGVDSSVALSLLKEQGFDVTAYYIRIWLEDELNDMKQCPWREDIDYVKKTCEKLKIDFKIVNLQQEYRKQIINEMFMRLRLGLTPNPDVYCNQHIKFGVFMKMLPRAFTHIASGHYAKITRTQRGAYQLEMSADRLKDQTYFLSYLNQEQLNRIIFPLAIANKSQVREYACKAKLPASHRKDSQGLCFLGKINFRQFVMQTLGEQPGIFIDWETQKTLGEHRGYWFYTIGQRTGLGLSNGPYYVVNRKPKKNIVYVSHNPLAESLQPKNFYVIDLNWIHKRYDYLQNVGVRIRHGGEIIQCELQKLEKSPQEVLSFIKNNSLANACYRVTLAKPDGGISSGQIAVFYDQHTCLGGGLIIEVNKMPIVIQSRKSSIR